jgi:ribonuclease P protein component
MEGYPRTHRFTVQGSFGTVLRASRKLRGPLATVHVMPGSAGPSRLGVGLTRKLVPRSVDRNCVKRVVREIFRRHMVKHAGLDCVVMLRGRFERSQLPVLRDEVRAHFDQLAPNIAT